MSNRQGLRPETFDHMRQSALDAVGRPAPLFKLVETPYLGYRMPRADDCVFTLDFAHFDTIRRCMVEHVATSGARFRAGANKDVQWLLASERLRLDHELKVAALRFLQGAIKAHNAVVQPIDNGPDDLVYLAETQYRVLDALVGIQGHRKFDPKNTAELRAAIAAKIYAGDGATRYFRNLNPQE